jgi:hypothetical protein
MSVIDIPGLGLKLYAISLLPSSSFDPRLCQLLMIRSTPSLHLP